MHSAKKKGRTTAPSGEEPSTSGGPHDICVRNGTTKRAAAEVPDEALVSESKAPEGTWVRAPERVQQPVSNRESILLTMLHGEVKEKESTILELVSSWGKEEPTGLISESNPVVLALATCDKWEAKGMEARSRLGFAAMLLSILFARCVVYVEQRERYRLNHLKIRKNTTGLYR